MFIRFLVCMCVSTGFPAHALTKGEERERVCSILEKRAGKEREREENLLQLAKVLCCILNKPSQPHLFTFLPF